MFLRRWRFSPALLEKRTALSLINRESPLRTLKVPWWLLADLCNTPREPFILSRHPKTLRLSVSSSPMLLRRVKTGSEDLHRTLRLSIFQVIKVLSLTLNLKTFSASLSPRTLVLLSIRSLSQGLIIQLTSATLVKLFWSTESQTIDAWLMRLSQLMLMIWHTLKTLTMLSKLIS